MSRWDDAPLVGRDEELDRLLAHVRRAAAGRSAAAPAHGRTNKQIGAELYISEKTASVHVSNILAKLGANGRTEAVAIAAQRGLLTGPG